MLFGASPLHDLATSPSEEAARRCTQCDHLVPDARAAHCPECGAALEVAAPTRGWKKIPRASIFQRFEAPEGQPPTPRHNTPSPPPPELAPATPTSPPRRASSFAFRPVERTSPPAREVEPVLLPPTIARHEQHAPDAERQAIEGLLGHASTLRQGARKDSGVGGEVVENDGGFGDVAVKGEPSPFIDVAFDAEVEEHSALIALDAFHAPLELSAAIPLLPSSLDDEEEAPPTLEIERDIERFELRLGERAIGPIDAPAVEALVASGLSGDAAIRHVDERDWRPLSQHPLFAPLYELDQALREEVDEEEVGDLLEDDAPDAHEALTSLDSSEEPLWEMDEAEIDTLFDLSAHHDASPVVSPPQDAPLETSHQDEAIHEDVEEAISPTLLMFSPAAAPEPEPALEPHVEAFEADFEEEFEDAFDLFGAPDEALEPAVQEPIGAPVPVMEEMPLQERVEAEGELVPVTASPTLRARQLAALRRSGPVLVALLLALLAFPLGVVIGPKLLGGEPVPDALDEEEGFFEAMISLPRERASRQAMRSARTLVSLSTRQDFMSPSRQQEVALELLQESRFESALKLFGVLWSQHPEARHPELARRYAETALTLERYDVARKIANQGALLAKDDDQKAAFAALFNQAIVQDPALHPETITLTPDDQVDVARALGGGKSISLRLLKEGESRYAFKPSQLDWNEGWRAEVASYLLCEAIDCHFTVPRSLPARISREDFELLYGRHTSPKQTDYATGFDRLLWVNEPGPDGKNHDYLYGVLKDWVPGFVDFPIEYGDLWRDWLDAEAPEQRLDRDLADALSPLRSRQQGKYYQPILSERRGASTRDVARSLSDVITFDFVTSNWDRHSGVETYYGVNNQFDEGRFLSLDNGAAFHVLTMSKVEQRFQPVTRFSRTSINAYRLLTPESTSPILFPAPGAEARDRLKTFWHQRDALLARVEKLIETHGEQKVLFFE